MVDLAKIEECLNEYDLKSKTSQIIPFNRYKYTLCERGLQHTFIVSETDDTAWVIDSLKKHLRKVNCLSKYEKIIKDILE